MNTHIGFIFLRESAGQIGTDFGVATQKVGKGDVDGFGSSVLTRQDCKFWTHFPGPIHVCQFNRLHLAVVV